MKIIVINNPAAKESGALTVLKSFIERSSNLKKDKMVYVFTTVKKLKKCEKENLKIILLEEQNFIKRIYWDNFGLKKYLKKNNIEPNFFLSLQNTPVNLDKKIPQFLYFHQALSITDIKWNFFSKEERKYWIYKNIYPFFIKSHLKKVKKVIVQGDWIKNIFSEKFNYNKNNIMVENPKLSIPNYESIKIIEKNKFRIFYPATPLVYKNHRVIIEALNDLNKERKDLDTKLECVFTFKKGENKLLDQLIKKYNLETVIKLIGRVSQKEVFEYYKSSDLLIFSSYLETIGLPLMEAQKLNLQILVSDLKYSREIMKNYLKVNYFSCDNQIELKKLIIKYWRKK